MIRPTFGVVNRLLTDLGYTSTTIPGSHILFEYPQPNRKIVLRPYDHPDDPFDLAELAYVRSALDAWGFLDRDEFDETIRERSREQPA